MTITADQPWLIVEIDVGVPVETGPCGAGSRRFIPLGGGTVRGALEGEIVPGGADWQTLRDDGTLEIEAHYAIRTTSGAIVEVISSGLRAASREVLARLAAEEAVGPRDYYFRTAIRLRTGAPAFAHLNDRLGIARGERRPTSVRLEIFEVF